MLQFIAGLMIGGVIGFGVCAILAATNRNSPTPDPKNKEENTPDE